MKPVFQSVFGEPNGNCLAACAASLLGLNIEDIPNFSEASTYDWWDDFSAFCLEHGYWILSIDPSVWRETGHTPRGYYIATGKSPRGDFYHAVIQRGGELVHDPHPEGGGLESEAEWWLFVATFEEKEALDGSQQ